MKKVVHGVQKQGDEKIQDCYGKTAKNEKNSV